MSYQEEFFKALMEDRVVLKKLGNQEWISTARGLVTRDVFFGEGDYQIQVVPENYTP